MLPTDPSQRAAIKRLANDPDLAQAAQAFAGHTAATSRKGNIRHSVCRWCYESIALETLCEAAVAMGIRSIDLAGPDEWETLRHYGLTCAMTQHRVGKMGSIEYGFNDPTLHKALLAFYTDLIPRVAAAGYTNVICFSGNRWGMDDATGLQHCAEALKQLMPLAQQHGVVVVMELLNSKVDHPDYMCDRTAWGVALCQAVGSEHFKLLYDIYHMQIMEGDVIRTIQEHHPYFAHYHTGGVPGRHEIDRTQELYYPAIMEAIVATGYQGFVAQEFIPKREEALASLRQGVEICDV
ncbi:hydroxypyruvate isomerase [Catalinimonas alkaloidigena]|uniref:Hydroxypyruvate isomerase n=1 Tax=Catalinimonas alkaloidigena TaxID=1075417 RepID=A0A1G9AQA0_9BACT|nr:TIM barrel protein [Catalinimonas alkaloidigena]SDK29421.1 hydroxypyruvate isomerase [Catalinimonas alkaloidigena]